MRSPRRRLQGRSDDYQLLQSRRLLFRWQGGPELRLNFTLERSFTQATIARASFHANYGNQIQSSQNFNQLDPKYIPIYGNLLTQPLSSLVSPAGVPTNAVLIANGYRLPYAAYPLTQTLGSSLDPYPQYSQGFSGTTNGGHSTYNALETQLQHNFAHGLFFQASYTFSKWLSDNTSPNVYVVNREKDLNSNDRTHVFALSYIYDIPLGRGKDFRQQHEPGPGCDRGGLEGCRRSPLSERHAVKCDLRTKPVRGRRGAVRVRRRPTPV